MNITSKYKESPVQVRASLWFLISSFLQKGISMISTPVFTRILTTDEFGRFNVFNSWYGIVSVIITLSLSYGVYYQGIIKFEEDRDRFSSSLQGLNITLVFTSGLIYLLFARFFNSLFTLSTIQVIAMIVLSWTSSAFSFWAVEQRAIFKYKALVILTLTVSFLKPTVGILLVVKASDKVTARILGLAIVELIGYSYCFITHMKKGKIFFHNGYWKYAVLYSLPLIPHHLSQTLLNNSDRIMIEKLVGADAAGIYSLAYSISMIMVLFNNALGQTIGPWMYKRIKEKQVDKIGPMAYITLSFIAFVNILLIIFAPEIVKLFAPQEYYQAIWVIPPIAMSGYFIFLYDYFSRFEFYYEKTRGVMVASLSCAAMNIVLNYLLIPLLGYMAAGYTTLISYIFYAIFHYVLMRKAIINNVGQIRVYNLRTITFISTAFILLGFLIMLTYKHIILRGMICLAIIILIFLYKDKIRTVINELKVTLSKS